MMVKTRKYQKIGVNLLLATFIFKGQVSTVMTERDNIVLITADSFRSDYCGWLGRKPSPTKTLDEIASDGVSFTQAVSPGPSTHESMPTIFTGDEAVIGVRGIESQANIREILSRGRTIPERLSERGYTTIGITANPFTSRAYGYDRDFDQFIDFLDSNKRTKIESTVRKQWAGNKLWRGLRFILNMSGRGDVSLRWDDYYEQILSTLQSATSPIFLWVFILEPHWPYQPSRKNRNGISLPSQLKLNWKASNLSNRTPSKDEAEKLRRLYEGTIRDVDEFVEKIVDDLSGLNPALIFHADHGEEFGENGHFGHGARLYPENIHVPLLIGNINQSDTITDPISLRNLPTMIEQIADGEFYPHEFTAQWSHAKTTLGDVATRSNRWHYYANRAGEKVYSDFSVDDKILRKQVETLTERKRLFEIERQLCRKTVADLTSL